eukprot:g2487.t1
MLHRGGTKSLKAWWEYGKKREDTKEEEYIPLIDTNYVYAQFHASPIGIDPEDDKAKEVRQVQKNSYWISRMLILRLLGFVYGAAFLIVGLQARALIGVNGLTPVPLHSKPNHLPLQGWFFMLFGWGNRSLELLGWSGFVLSLFMLSGRVSSPIVAFLLWGLYQSFYLVSHMPEVRFFHYGWDFQLLETGFLAIFLCPMKLEAFCNVCSRRNSYFESSSTHNNSPLLVILWLFRWLGFRLMLGAGLSKIMASEPCWKYSKLDCMAFFYETTGNPSPLAWLLHKSPMRMHNLEVLGNHFVELVLPWLFLSPWRSPRHFAGVLHVVFQIILILGGNYAFLNHLTIVPCLALFDDAFLLKYAELLPSSWNLYVTSVYKDAVLTLQSDENDDDEDLSNHRSCCSSRFLKTINSIMRFLVPAVLACFIGIKSKPALENLFGPHPWLNTFDNFAFVNSYGVFGSITKTRYDMVLKYTHDPVVDILKAGKDTDNSPVEWKELPFKCKADVLSKWPCVTTPYYHRLDWETWIDVTAIGEFETEKKAPPYILTLIGKILHGDKDAASLLRLPLSELFIGEGVGIAPTAIATEFYLYKYSNVSDLIQHGNWWKRDKIPLSSSIFVKQLFKKDLKKTLDEVTPSRDCALLFLCLSFTLAYIEAFPLEGQKSIWILKDKLRIAVTLFASLMLSYAPNFSCSLCSALGCAYCAWVIVWKLYIDISGKVKSTRHAIAIVILVFLAFAIYHNVADFNAWDDIESR